MPETLEGGRDWRSFWNSPEPHLDSDELLVQVGRTVGGRPIGAGEVSLAVAAAVQGLELSGEDVLLDLCCGNGLITRQLAPVCRAVVGVDCSRRLIEVARERSSAPNVTYQVGAAEELDSVDFAGLAPNKLSMLQALQHLTVAGLGRLLTSLDGWDSPIVRLCLTDVPDRDLIFAFYDTPERREEFHRRRAAGTEAIGTWWSRDELAALLGAHGYEVEFRRPLCASYAHYRFDVVAWRR